MLSPTPLYIKMEPNKELRFSGDFRESVVEGLTLRNPGKVPLLFKVFFGLSTYTLDVPEKWVLFS